MRVSLATVKGLFTLRNMWLQIGLMAVAAVGLTLSPFTTQKAAAAMLCQSQQVCMWEHSYGGGQKLTYTSLNRFTCYTLPTGWWDRVSSMYNRLDYTVYFYSLSGCGGWAIDLGTGQLRSDLSGTGMNDEIRSIWVN